MGSVFSAAEIAALQDGPAPGNGDDIAEIWRLPNANDSGDSDVSDETNPFGGPLASSETDTVIGDVPRTKVGTYAVRIASGSGVLGTAGIGSERMVGERELPAGQFYLFFNAAQVESGSDILDSDQVHIVAGVYDGAAGNKGKTGVAYRWFQIMDAGGQVTEQVERMVRAAEIRG
jgi:hypothetical protein